jgi:type II restriction/modification system DNA methylase subunit YeeA
MTPQQFITKWRNSTLKESAAAQEHFIDLCRLIGQPTPAQADPDGSWFTFEKGASKTGGGEGWADVWRKGCFAWEYKGKRKDLNAAFVQLQRYAIALENPPLLVVSDMDTIIIHTNFTNTVQQIHTIALEDIERPEAINHLRRLFTDPESFRPGVTREAVTAQAAEAFASLAQRLRDQGHDGRRVAHFINKLLFSMFAEDIGLLPAGIFTRILENSAKRPDQFMPMVKGLFTAMQGGGFFGAESIEWFNGGLFDDDDTLPVDEAAAKLALKAARLDWSDIEPSIFGTLFERGLDPSKRSQLGAHYTDRQSIMRIIKPVVVEPLVAEWEATKAEIELLLTKATAKARKKADELYYAFLLRLHNVRVLDPACGSGNFLYLALLELKNLEYRVMLEAEALGFHRSFFQVGPHNVMGIEVNDYAAELARVTIWIGEIQWMLKNGMGYSKKPVLQKLEQIECRDAIMNQDGSEAAWPAADYIVGNPPFLGGSKMLGELGEEYVTQLREVYKGRVLGGADLVTYWFEKARSEIEAGRAKLAGLVATNSIRGGTNREVLKRICAGGRIYNAWSDEPWINEGAAVRVSLLCFDGAVNSTSAAGMVSESSPVYGVTALLDGRPVTEVFPDLTAGQNGSSGIDLTQASPLAENKGFSFQGSQKIGAFDISGDIARQWLRFPSNPNGRTNTDVVKPSWNGIDVARRPRDMWIIDFGTEMQEKEAALYEAPFQYVLENVKPERDKNNREAYRKYWWRHGEPRIAMRSAMKPLLRYIVTPHVSKHRLFVFLPIEILPDKMLILIARDDDTTFGILHSRFHELWALRMCTFMGAGNDPRYTPSTAFETFPFPAGLTPNIPAADYATDPRAQTIAEAARRLVELRDAWLNPPELVKREPEVVSGYPDRLLPVDAHAATELKKRTLTNLYNVPPAWLVNAHRALDEAVAAAYGWESEISSDEVLEQLLVLNHSSFRMS